MFLAIDLGTSGCRAVLFDDKGSQVASASKSSEVHNSAPGYAEQDPQNWWDTVVGSITEIVSGNPGTQIEAITVTGLGVSFVFLDACGEPLSPAPLGFMDKRLNEVSVKEGLTYEEDKLYRTIEWFRQNDPDVIRRTESILDAREYIGYRLCGRKTRDGRLFSESRLRTNNLAHGVSDDLFPEPHTYTDPIGQISNSVRRNVGMDRSPAIVVGPFDGLCCVIGSGLVSPRQAMAVCGTTNAVAVCVDDGVRVPTIPHVIDNLDLYYESEAVGIAYEWFKDEWLPTVSDPTDVDELVEMTTPKSDGPVFVPFVRGETEKPHMRGGFVGITADHGRSELARSIYEGEAYFLREKLSSTESDGMKADELIVSGGRSKSGVWNQIRADVTGLPVKRVQTAETAALGGAILASVASGRFGSLEEAIAEMVTVVSTTRPQQKAAQLYDEQFRLYTHFYSAIDEGFTTDEPNESE